MNEINVRQKHFATAVSGEAKLEHHCCLGSLRQLATTVEICALSITLGLELGLIPEPLICKELTTIHTAHGNDHCTYF